jgi:hypothetical protein
MADTRDGSVVGGESKVTTRAMLQKYKAMAVVGGDFKSGNMRNRVPLRKYDAL